MTPPVCAPMLGVSSDTPTLDSCQPHSNGISNYLQVLLQHECLQAVCSQLTLKACLKWQQGTHTTAVQDLIVQRVSAGLSNCWKDVARLRWVVCMHLV